LQKLEDSSDNRRKFEIDNHLKQYSKAMGHLALLEDFEEIKRYTTLHKLYSDALLAFRYDSNRHDAIVKLYADDLYSNSKWKEAGLSKYQVILFLNMN
jgi:elongator complex protein 1